MSPGRGGPTRDPWRGWALPTLCLAGTGRSTSTGPKTPTSWSCWKGTGWTSCSSATTAGSWVRGHRGGDRAEEKVPPSPLANLSASLSPQECPGGRRNSALSPGITWRRCDPRRWGPRWEEWGWGLPTVPLRPPRVPAVSPHGDEVPPAPSRPYGAASNRDKSPRRGGSPPPQCLNPPPPHRCPLPTAPGVAPGVWPVPGLTMTAVTRDVGPCPGVAFASFPSLKLSSARLRECRDWGGAGPGTRPTGRDRKSVV